MMGSIITKRQKELLQTIYNFIKDTGFPPTFEEMRQNLNVSSNQSIIDLLKKLQDSCVLNRKEGGARSLSILPLGYKILNVEPITPYLGVTSAGVPLQSFDIVGEWLSLSKEVSRLDADFFVLKVSGDSMINAGIDDGDSVLVQTKKEFLSGEIVYAQIGDSSTIKRFMSDDKPPYIYLKPENPKYSNILFTDDTELKGKVVSVLKK